MMDGWCRGGVAGPDTAENIVFIAQLTTSGSLSFSLNISTLGVSRFILETGDISPRYNTNNINYPLAGGPGVSITNPENEEQFDNETITIEATASDTDGNVIQVEFFVDGSSIGTDETEPYQMEWTVTAGDHVIIAVATDNDELTGTSLPVSIHGTTLNYIEDIIAPSFKLFPNPSEDGLFYLDIKTADYIAEAYYSIYDLVGNELMFIRISDTELKSNNIIIDLSAYSKGIYFINLKVGNVTYSSPLIRH